MKLNSIVGIIFSKNVKMNELLRKYIKVFNWMYTKCNVDNMKYLLFDQMNLEKIERKKYEVE